MLPRGLCRVARSQPRHWQLRTPIWKHRRPGDHADHQQFQPDTSACISFLLRCCSRKPTGNHPHPIRYESPYQIMLHPMEQHRWTVATRCTCVRTAAFNNRKNHHSPRGSSYIYLKYEGEEKTPPSRQIKSSPLLAVMSDAPASQSILPPHISGTSAGETRCIHFVEPSYNGCLPAVKEPDRMKSVTNEPLRPS